MAPGLLQAEMAVSLRMVAQFHLVSVIQILLVEAKALTQVVVDEKNQSI